MGLSVDASSTMIFRICQRWDINSTNHGCHQTMSDKLGSLVLIEFAKARYKFPAQQIANVVA